MFFKSVRMPFFEPNVPEVLPKFPGVSVTFVTLDVLAGG